MTKKLIYILISYILILLNIQGCSNKGSSGTSQLEIVVPNTYFIGKSTMPIIIENHGDSAVKNISFSLPINDANLNISNLDNKCQNIAPQNTCQIDFPLDSNVTKGSAQIQISTEDNKFISDIIDFSEQKDKGGYGANAISLYGDPVLNKNGDGTVSAMITAIIGGNIKYNESSIKLPPFNHISLVDGNGAENPYCQQISGPDLTDTFESGDVLTYYCRVPDSITTIELATQLQMVTIKQNTTNSTSAKVETRSLNASANTNVTIVDTGAVQIMIDVKNNSTRGNITQHPPQIKLGPKTPSAPVTIENNGIAPVTIGQITSPNSDVLKITEDNCSGKILATAETCNYVVELVDPSKPFAGTGNITVLPIGESNTSYSDNNLVVDYSGESPVVNIQLNTNDVKFIDTKSGSSITKTITVVNLSKSAVTPQDISPQILQSNSFSINGTSLNNYCYNGSAINPEQSCSFNLVYNKNSNPLVTGGSFNLELPFITGSGPYSTSLHVSYSNSKFVQLIATDKNANPVSNLSFDTIYNDNSGNSSQEITIYNQGNSTATNFAYRITSDNHNLFTIPDGSSNCSNTLDAGSSCKITIKFGPINNGVSGDYNANLIISYGNATNETIQDNIILNGTVVNIGNAILNGSVTSSTSAGSGIVENPFLVAQGSESPMLITYTINNPSDITAESVTITLAQNNGWSMIQDNCSNTSITPKSSCNLQLTIQDTSTVGTRILNLADMVVSWNSNIPSQIGRVTDEQTGSIYVKVLPAPEPTPTPTPTPVVSPTPNYYLANQNVRSVAVDSNNNAYAMVEINNSTVAVYKNTNSDWSQVGDILTNINVESGGRILIDNNNNLYVVGTQASNVANILAYRFTLGAAAWKALPVSSGGGNIGGNAGYNVAYNRKYNQIYVVNFTQNMQTWTGSSWVSSQPVAGIGGLSAVNVDQNGSVYFGGWTSTNKGFIASYDSGYTSSSILAADIGNYGSYITSINFDNKNTMYFINYDPNNLMSEVYQWNGSMIIQQGSNISYAAPRSVFDIDNNNFMYIAYNEGQVGKSFVSSADTRNQAYDWSAIAFDNSMINDMTTDSMNQVFLATPKGVLILPPRGTIAYNEAYVYVSGSNGIYKLGLTSNTLSLVYSDTLCNQLLRYGNTMVGICGYKIVTSMDGGNSWTVSLNYSLSSIAVNSKGQFVAAGGNGTLLYSNDGLNWSTPDTVYVDSGGYINTCGTTYSNCTYTSGLSVHPAPNDKFLVQTSLGTLFFMNGDGTSRTQIRQYTGPNYYNMYAHGISSNGDLLAGGPGGSILVGSSSTGYKWESVPLSYVPYGNIPSFCGTVLSFTSSQKLDVLAGRCGLIMYSHDNGQSWTQISDVVSQSDINTVTQLNDGTFIAVGTGGIITRSEDGIHWRVIQMPRTISFSSATS